MSRFFKGTFLIHAVVALVVGAPLLIAPGQFLGLFGWAPRGADPLPVAGGRAAGAGLELLPGLAVR